jgi:hypothetical protein
MREPVEELYTAYKSEAMETPIRMNLSRTTSGLRGRHSVFSAGLALAVIALSALVGCSSGNSASKPQVGAITFTDVNGTPVKTPLTSLTVSQGTYLDVTLTNDPKLLGADWSVYCGSALPPGSPLPPGQTQDESCGTFTPGHTISGPIPTYQSSAAGYVTFYTAPAVPPKQGIVTLYASSTSDPSVFSSVTIAINGLPISVGFAPAPPSSLGLSVATQFKAVLENDATGAGVNWTVLCSSSDCGSFNPTQTASGVLTTYTSPATVPTGGTVRVTATSIADPTKSASATIQIAPVSVSITPAVLSVATAGTGTLTANVAYDGLNKGVNWSVSCTNTTSPSNCGTITPHTASGAPATYTAPSVANIAVGSTVNVTATSVTDPTKSATAVVTTIQGNLATGIIQADGQPVRHAEVALYAAASSGAVVKEDANVSSQSATTVATTGEDGTFSIPYGYQCPSPDTQMYLVSSGGDAGGGTNSSLVLMSAVGSCSKLDTTHYVINEATTVAAVYALSGFMSDAQHVGSGSASPAGIVAAFATAKDLVDNVTGVARQQTVSGAGIAPQAKINTLANLLSACASSGGSKQGDGSACDRLFSATNPGTTPATQANNTAGALLNLAHNATGFANHQDSFTQLYQLATSIAPFMPELGLQPDDWTLSIDFPDGQRDGGEAVPDASLSKSLSTTGVSSLADSAGNVWVRGSDTLIEFVGAASCEGASQALTQTAAGLERIR